MRLCCRMVSPHGYEYADNDVIILPGVEKKKKRKKKKEERDAKGCRLKTSRSINTILPSRCPHKSGPWPDNPTRVTDLLNYARTNTRRADKCRTSPVGEFTLGKIATISDSLATRTGDHRSPAFLDKGKPVWVWFCVTQIR